MLKVSAKTKRTRVVILTTGIISSLWKLGLCILLIGGRREGHKHLLLELHDHVCQKQKGIFINWLNFRFWKKLNNLVRNCGLTCSHDQSSIGQKMFTYEFAFLDQCYPLPVGFKTKFVLLKFLT